MNSELPNITNIWLTLDSTRDADMKKEGNKRESVLLQVNGEKTKQATPSDQLKAIKHKVEDANSGSPALWGLFRCLVYQVVACFKAMLTITMLKLARGWLQIESILGVAEDEGGGLSSGRGSNCTALPPLIFEPYTQLLLSSNLLWN